MNESKWINDAWELDEVIADPTFQEFIDGLFNCKCVSRITLLGSIVIGGREPFNRYPDRPSFIDIDVGVEYSASMCKKHGIKLIPHLANSGVGTREIVDYLKKFGLKRSTSRTDCFRPVVYVPSPNAPDSYYGKKYVIHIERKPYEKNMVLRER